MSGECWGPPPERRKRPAAALTVHQAQGSEFDNVLLIDEWFGESRARWLYIGITRAKERIVIARKGA